LRLRFHKNSNVLTLDLDISPSPPFDGSNKMFFSAFPFSRYVKDHPERTTRRFARFVEIMGFEPTTYGLQSRRSSQLSYIPS
jgi:hypothetical protein